MNFDLMVFDPAHAPRVRGEFIDWFIAGTRDAAHDYSSPQHLSGPLRQFYDRLETVFPPQERLGPVRAPGCADYCFAQGFIYLSFLRETADQAYRTVLDLAHDCGEILHDREQYAYYRLR